MGTTKKLPIQRDNTDLTQIFPIVPLNERVYISDSQIRLSLQKFIDSGINNLEFTNICNFVQQEFARYLVYCSKSTNDLRVIDQKYPLVREVIEILSKCESICAIVRLTTLSTDERKLIADLALGKTVTFSKIKVLLPRVHFIKLLTNSLPPHLDILNDKITLQVNVAEVLFTLLKQIQLLMRKPTRTLTEVNPLGGEDFFNCFPALHTNLRIPQYGNDHNEKQRNCTKLYPKHQRFSPGLLVMVCQHRICYGFEIMSSRESTILVFNMLLRKFHQMPEVIIYDNACNLHTTCIMRDPFLFRNTTFLIDRFHSTNHQCDPIFSMRTWQTNEMGAINSQICEQTFSLLRRIATQVAYMRIENIFYNTRYFLACLNNTINN